mmetsp:Transcript_31413/g.57722  ORF Transcript_31413/g.57722 Transcript_31413/m.57722 type:complete len:108 (+) Transcript_31413:104-427(+)
MASAELMNKAVPLVGAAVFAYGAYHAIPVMYRWDLIPGVPSPDYEAKAAKIRYNYYSNGIVYDAYDTGEPRTELPPECRGVMILKDKHGRWRPQKEIEAEMGIHHDE